MKNEFLIAITQLSAEKNLPKEVVFQAVESALALAYRKESFAGNPNISVKIIPQTGEVKVYAQKTVVEQAVDVVTEISLGEARRSKPDAALGEEIIVEVTPANAGRIAAQTAKQVVLQRLREAEREIVFEEYVGKESEVVSGVVQRIEPKQIILDVGRTEAILPASEQMTSARYRVGQRLKVFVLEVHRSNRGPQIVVSRTHKNLLRRLFELEVPEIYNGTVEIKAIAREPGQRSKVAVIARQEGIDPVGSCVGLRGIRIQNIVNELQGERVDVVLWDPDPGVFVRNALSPAQVSRVLVDEVEKTATVVVPDRQLSLAIGREGQNARLAAKLTGWRVDIKSSSTFAEMVGPEVAEAVVAAPAEVEAAPPVAEEALAPGVAEVGLPELEATPEPVAEKIPAMPAAEAAVAGEEEFITIPVFEAPVEVEMPAPLEPLMPVPIPSMPRQIRFAEEVLPARAEAKAKRDKKKAEEEEGKVKAKKTRARPHRVEVDEDELTDLWK